MKTFRHSGTLGDLIYSLSVVKKMERGEFKVALHNIENCVSQYNYRPEEVDPAHRGRFTEQDYAWLKPLLERQSYIGAVSTWSGGDPQPDVDLDRFRGVLFRGFEGNYVQAYHMTFGMPLLPGDLHTAWLEADRIIEAPTVVSRTFRYRCPNGDTVWREIARNLKLDENGVFIGTEEEWQDFQRVTEMQIRHRPVQDFLEMANIINGCDTFLGNQNFAYSLAMGLGKPAVLETIKIKPLENNECFFPRKNIVYF